MRYCWLPVLLLEAPATNLVFAKAEITDNWKAFPTRTLADLPGAVTNQLDASLSRFGGLLARKMPATGFFYPTNLNGRWWLVDPDGCLFLRKGVTDVTMLRGDSSKTMLQEKFGSESNWVARTTDFLRSQGFNSLGAWSDTDHLRQTAQPLVYTRILNFMSSYGEKRGGTYQQPGHIGYPKDCIFVFDPEFETFCDTHARQLLSTKNDPWLLGTFSDNELPLRRDALKNYLSLPHKTLAIKLRQNGCRNVMAKMLRQKKSRNRMRRIFWRSSWRAIIASFPLPSKNTTRITFSLAHVSMAAR
ncbi:MAG: hypothetical protein WDM76_06585 [Limisphaerales bacterium]